MVAACAEVVVGFGIVAGMGVVGYGGGAAVEAEALASAPVGRGS
jgi:hypothetical protein